MYITFILRKWNQLINLQALACFKILPNREIFPVFVSLPCVDN